ncbi:MAG: AAA family ATPase [Gluconobacter cerinus]|uniref:AAA family ATPase n=1 Tax=Gluconobacter cerinus TaxID=38307 RepID=UPI0039E79525
MRFDRLDLFRYGGFQERTITFPKSEGDFHVIHGHNEAGKSTMLAAIRDFLFQFPHHISADWLSAAPLLRVGGQVSHNGAVLEGIRRRARTQTFYASDDATPKSDELLRQWMGDLDAKSFETGWALDHRRLREGGEEMRRLKDDAGLQILSAGLGVGGLGGLITSLEKEMNSQWRKGSSTSAILKAKRDLSDLNKTLRNTAVLPHDLTVARETQEKEEKALSECNAEHQRLVVRQRENSRARNISIPYLQLMDLQLQLSQSGLPEFSFSECDNFEVILSEIKTETTIESATKLKLDSISERINESTPRGKILDDANRIISLINRNDFINKIDIDTNLRLDRIRNDEIWMEQFWARHRATPNRLPDAGALDALNKKLQERENYLTLEHEIKDRLEKLRQEFDLIRSSNFSSDERKTVSTADFEHLKTNLNYARSLGGIDDEIEKLKKDLKTAIHDTNAAFDRLLPWSAITEKRWSALDGLPVLEKEIIDEEYLKWRDLEEKSLQENSLLLKLQETLSKKIFDRDILEKSGDAVSIEALSNARDLRDTTWCNIQGILQTEQYPDPSVLNAFFILLKNTDILADRRHTHAEQSARLNDLSHHISSIKIEAAQVEKNILFVKSQQISRQNTWFEKLKYLGLPALPPKEFLSWCDARLDALSKSKHQEQIAESFQKKQQQKRSALEQLSPYLQEAQMDNFVLCLQHAQNIQDEYEAHLRSALDKKQAQERLQTAIAAEERQLETLKHNLAAWQVLWETACASCHYPAGARHVDLVDVQEARSIQIRLENEKKEHHKNYADILEFKNSLNFMLEKHNKKSLENLCTSLRQSEEAEHKRQEFITQRATLQETLEATTIRLTSLRQSLAPILMRLGIPYSDDLHNIAAELRHRATLLQRRDELNNIILSAGNGRALEALLLEAKKSDPATLERESDELEQQSLMLKQKHSEIEKRLWDARQVLTSLENTGGAHETAERIQEVEAELNDRAARYVSLRLQSLMLRRLVEKQRQETHGPLLEKAGSMFSHLTRHQYAGIALEDTGTDNLTLSGLLPDKSSLVPVHSMSEGTRDQLYLALRLASVEQSLDRGIQLPFIADDLFITFDEERSLSGLELLSSISKRTQILFFTHHAHIADIAKNFGHIIRL